MGPGCPNAAARERLLLLARPCWPWQLRLAAAVHRVGVAQLTSQLAWVHRCWQDLPPHSNFGSSSMSPPIVQEG